MKLWEREIAALDFETTGLYPDHGDRAIEVAVVRGRFGDVPTRWSTLIDPTRPMDATRIHGITDEMVRGKPRFGEIAPTLTRMLRGAVVVAHNARFDLSFLRMEYARAGLWAPEPTVLDTLGLSRRVLALPSNSLASVCTHMGLERQRAHRALEDAVVTWEIAWRLLDKADPERKLTETGAVDLCRRRTQDEQRYVAAALSEALRASAPIVIEYQRPDATATRRAITVHKVNNRRVEAFCHLRGEDRVFRLDRISLVG